MIERSTISHIHWQKRLVPPDGDLLSGEIVTDYRDIEQEIRIILMTQIGSVPTNPLKGCDLMSVIDLPAIEATPMVIKAIWEAITAWVSRIEIGTITAEPQQGHHWQVVIPWRPRGDVWLEFKDFNLDVRLAGGLAFAN